MQFHFDMLILISPKNAKNTVNSTGRMWDTTEVTFGNHHSVTLTLRTVQ